jgi:ABC-type multidrug transport system ATPase subunit
MIKTENLTKRYQNHLAVDRLNLDVRPGEIYGFLGPNGAGKTTTIHMLLGLISPTSGRLLVLGETIGPYDFAFKRQVGVVAEEPIEDSKMSGWEPGPRSAWTSYSTCSTYGRCAMAWPATTRAACARSSASSAR